MVLETLTHYGTRLAVAQKYLPEIKTGRQTHPAHRRGAGALCPGARPGAGRVPRQPGSRRQRRGRGAHERDRWIAAQVGPTLREKGLMFVGLDVIGDWLTEINVTSPTCVRELDALYKLDIAGQFMDKLAAKLGDLNGRDAHAAPHAPRLDSPAVTARDRLVTTLFFAALVHGIIILGITFRPDTPAGSPTLEVTMVQSRSVTPPDDAHYIAQANQRATGNTEELVRPESPLSMPAALNNAGRPTRRISTTTRPQEQRQRQDRGRTATRAPTRTAAVTTTAATGMNANATRCQRAHEPGTAHPGGAAAHARRRRADAQRRRPRTAAGHRRRSRAKPSSR